MASPPRAIPGHTGKVSYAARSQAEAALHGMIDKSQLRRRRKGQASRRGRDALMGTYLCSYCNAYHIGHDSRAQQA